MSERTPCNFCTLQQIREHLAAKGSTAHIEKSDGVFTAFVYELKAGVDFTKLTHKERRDVFVAGFVELPESCAC
jgi:hypothetical protein